MSVIPVNVLVIFSSLCGNTERLALAAAVGAVQARANIRMRRLPDSGENVPACKDDLARMRKEYVPPTAADTQWADAVIIGINGSVAGVATDPEEATAFGRRAATQARERKQIEK
jgi:NAD(P)H dehydrogenase (quinone)